MKDKLKTVFCSLRLSRSTDFLLRSLNVYKQISRIIGLLLIMSSSVWAAGEVAAPALPGSVLPGQVGKAIREQQPSTEIPVEPVIAAPAEQEAPTPTGEAVKKIKFRLIRVILEGNHVYSDAQLSALYKDKLNTTITILDLFGIVQNITNYYRNTGYILTQAILPPQHVKEGIVNIKVVEGFLANVNVSGTPKGARRQVLALGAKIKECPPLQLNRMEKYLLLANELPGTQVRAVLGASPSATGAADLTLDTENKPVTGYFSYDNYGTGYIGPQQLTANLGFNSIFDSGDSMQLTTTKTPKGGELTYSDITYSMPVDEYGTRWTLGGTRVQTHPLFVLKPVQIDGVNENISTSLSFPVIRKPSENLSLQISLNYLDSGVEILGTPLYTDHLRSFGFGGTYNFSDKWAGANLINADIRQGLPVLGYTSDTKIRAASSRAGGRGDYTKIDFQMSRMQSIKTWPLSLYGLIKGQYAFNPLLTYEQFSYGGSQLGRGYDVAEFLGDKGLAGTVEVHYDLAINKILQSIQFYLFYDAGVFWNYYPAKDTKQSAMSTGLGARFNFTNYISGNVMWTQVLTSQISGEKIIGQGKRPRVFFSVVASLPNA